MIVKHGILASSKDEGRDIVPGGLELYYDSRNASSYPGAGTTIFDISTNGRDGNLITPTYNGATQGLVFNGAGDYINTGYSYSLASGEVTDFTITTLTSSVTSADSTGMRFSNHNGTPVPFFVYVLKSTGFAFAITRGGGGTVVSITGTTDLNDGLEHVMTYRKQGTLYSLFVDGVLEGSATSSVGPTPSSNIVIGRLSVSLSQSRFQGEFFAGLIYSVALSDAEILQNYNALI